MKLQNAWVVLVLDVCLCGTVLMSQTPTGSMSGVVSDTSGAVIPGAKVTVTDTGKGISRSVTTDSAGRYQAPGLIPGSYEIEAQMEGFQTEIRKGIQLTVGMDAVINLTLQVGQVAQTTIVAAEAPLVETVSGTVSGLVDERTIRDLPLNGRSFDQLISLESSAPQFRYRNASVAVGNSSAYSMNGARPSANTFLMDGTEVAGASASETLPGGSLGKNMGVEAIQEFTVLTSNYSAVFGKRAGGVINVATRSGTNLLHGSAFEFLRNSALDARGFFDPEKPSFRRNQFGGAVGGPIRKDHTFFFGNYEGLREGLGLTNIAIFPDNNARQGLLPSGPNGSLVNVGVTASVKPYFVLFPQVNGRNFGDGTGEFLNAATQVSRQDFFLVRVDHKLSDKDSFFARYNFTDASLTAPDLNPTFHTFNPSRDQVVTLQESRAYPTLMNLLRFGFTRSSILNNDLPSIPLDSSLFFIPGAPALGSISFATPNQASVPITGAGSANKSGTWFVANQFEFGDQVYYYRGPHSIQFGAKLQRIQHNDRNLSINQYGTFTFADLAGFLQGKPTQFNGLQSGGSSDAQKGWRHNYFATFLQDDWKTSRNLTLNLGVRWEFLTAPSEASGNRISNFRTGAIVDGFNVLATAPFLGAPLYHSNFGTVAPRIGFAWDTFGDGKMALRGGFGIFYDQLEKEPYSSISQNPPFYNSLQVTNPNFPLGFSGAAGRAAVPSPNGLDLNATAATRSAYSLSLEREITTDTLFKIGYVGSRSYHLMRQSDNNVAVAQVLPGGVLFYPANAPRRNPQLGSSRFRSTDATARYNSLQLDFHQRPSHGLRYKLSYSFSKSIDSASGSSAPEAQNNGNNTQNPDDLRADQGLSAFAVKHSFVANFTYDLPGENLSGMAGRLVGGWQLGTIATLQSGTPFTALVGFNRSRDGDRTVVDRPDLPLGANSNPVLGGSDQYYDPTVFVLPPAGYYGNAGRNTLIGPGVVNVDLTLVKMIPVTERFRMDFRAELFNILNHANFGLPDQSVFNTNGSLRGAAGRIKTTVTSSRQIQFALKLLF